MAKWDEISGSVDYKNLSTTDKSALRTEYFKRVIVPELETSDIESGYAEFMRRTEPSFTDKALDYVPEFMGGNKATGAEQEVTTPPITATKQENDWYAQAKRENPNAWDAEIAARMTEMANGATGYQAPVDSYQSRLTDEVGLVRGQRGASGSWGSVPPTQEGPGGTIAPTQRTAAETARDAGLGFMEGSAQTGKMLGDIYGIITGDMNNWVSSNADAAAKYWRAKQSKTQRDIDSAAQKQIAADEARGGFWAGLWSGAKHAVDDPLMTVSRQLSNLAIGGAGSVVTKGLAKKFIGQATERTLIEIGTAGGIATGAAMQGADIGSDAYEEVAKTLIKKGVPAEVAHTKALALGRTAAVKAAVVSIASNKLVPFGDTLERVFAGGLRSGGLKGAAIGAMKAISGESIQEGIEEGAGKLFQNEAVGTVDPTVALMREVGGATGQGMATGALMGGAPGAIAGFVGGQDAQSPTTDTSQKPTETIPPRGYMTRDQIDAAANAELDRINLKAKGTPDQTINGPDGKPVVVQGEPAQPLSDEDRSIRDFIIANQGNHEKLAGAFGYGVARDTPVAPTTAPTGPLTSALAAAPVAPSQAETQYVPPTPLQESAPVAASDDAALLARIQQEQGNDAIQADELLDEPITEKAPNGPSDLAAAPDYPDANVEDGDQVQSANLPGSGIAIPDAMPGLPGGDSSGAGVPVGDGATPVQPSGGVEPGEALEQPAISMETTTAKPDAYAKTFVELAKLSNEVQERIDALHNKLDGEGVSWDDQKNHPELESLYQKRVDIDTAAAQKGYDGARKVAEEVLSGMPHESPFSSIESILRERYSLTNNPQAGVYMMSKYTGKAIDNPLTIDETARDIQHLIVARDYPKADFDLLMDSQMSVLTRKSRDAIIRESINKAKELNDGIRDFFIADSIAAATPINAKAKLDALKAKQQSRLKPIDDARVPDMADDLREMAKFTGWAQEGWRMIRGSEDFSHPDYNKISRTTWIPHQKWYSGMENKLSGQDAIDAVDDAIAGRPMKVKAQRFVSELMDIIADERKQAAETKSARLHFEREQLASEAGALGIDATGQSAEQIKAAIDAIYAQYDQLEREALQETVNFVDDAHEEIDDIPFGEDESRIPADLNTIFGAAWNEESKGEAQGPDRQETAPAGIAPAVPGTSAKGKKEGRGNDETPPQDAGLDERTTKPEREGVAKDEAAPAFSLSGQTPEEVKAQEQDRLEQIKLEEAETKKRDEDARKLAIENERKGRVGIASDEYTLDATEGNAAAQKRADKARADDQFAGQGDIFAQPTPAKPKAQPADITVNDIPPMILQQIMVKMPGHQQGEVSASEALETNRKAIEQMRNFMNCIKAN